MAYQRHNFERGNRLLASQLNEMEDQIILSESSIEELQNGSGNSPFVAGTGDYSIKAVNNTNVVASEYLAYAEGYATTASGQISHAEGNGSTASGFFSHAEGYQSTASGDGSHAEGYRSSARQMYSHAEGFMSTAGGSISHAEGNHTIASGDISHAEGYLSEARNDYTHAEGQASIASGNVSHAEGHATTASGVISHAEGQRSVASGVVSHSEGYETTASGDESHAEGSGTIANRRNQHVFGSYNVEDPSMTGSYDRGNYIEIVGNGYNKQNRSNARTLDWNGNEALQGGITLGAGTNNETTLTPADLRNIKQGSPWELIREDTIPNSQTADIVISVDNNGLPFALNDIKLMLIFPKQQTRAGMSNYGRVRFYYNNLDCDVVSIESWTQEAGASAQSAKISITQKDGLIETWYTTHTQDSSSPMIKINNSTTMVDSTCWQLTDKTYTKIVLGSVFGTCHYILLGRRKN